MPTRSARLRKHVADLRRCELCADMKRPVIVGAPVLSSVLLVGQAPGPRGGDIGRPNAWTAGKTMLKWFCGRGLGEDAFREHVYIAAVCRCFPGKKPRGGDRVPSPSEVANCARWLRAEAKLLRPALVIPVGKLAISQFLDFKTLVEVVGRQHRVELAGRQVDAVPLPHPSGASTWHRREPGVTLLDEALQLVARHPAWIELMKAAGADRV
jgi:uracil-DNA glycosylase